MFCQAERLAIGVKNSLFALKKRLILIFFFRIILFIEYLLYLYAHKNPIKSETLY
ncbi:hypothetical protein HMPREF9441_03498 [Paraprevotella clara YIT 11840]|jgi:hypothetical protein|uniref:Uncharacterized protein n=1 Tax=Paraprevotella clara YIT 11840 TaxID=762968 RepID=G5SVT1_9BACT|nr:hypothetical protein HMPREF9441_03498 [Paraprevotella clara YIT 11840]